jgi:broad specificity phosphatase PhoE
MLPCPAADTCVAFLLRHGATANNLADPPRLQGRTVDGPLSATGLRQAKQAADLLASQPLAAVYSSPLQRAQQTAQFIALLHAIRVQVVAALTEVDVGLWEDRSWVEIRANEADYYDQFQHDPAHVAYRGGENLQQVSDRVLPALEEILNRHLGQCVAIIGHNVVNRAILSKYMHVPLPLARHLVQDNGGINVLRFAQGQTRVESVNSNFHLVE